MTDTVASDTVLYPLSLFRRNDGVALPAYAVIEGSQMPQPYRDLLVHNGDMTSRLETFHGGPIVLEVLHCEHSREVYRREVVLHVERSGIPVEYGAIEIQLDAFDEDLRGLIVEAHLPLGGLLNRFKVNYHSRPVAFIELGADPVMRQHFGVPEASRFFGRSNVLVGDGGRELARIVELLRP